MKKQLVFPVLMTCFLAGAGFAQTPNSARQAKNKTQQAVLEDEEKAVKEASRAEKDLGLSAEQKARWQEAALVRIYANKPHKQRLKGSTTPEERKLLRKQIRINKNNFDQTVSASLTHEQNAKWQALKAEKKKNKQRKRN